MNKIEIGIIITIILSIAGGIHYLGKMEGRLSSVEANQDGSIITKIKKDALSSIKEAKKSALKSLDKTSNRITALENRWTKKRKPGSVITLSHGASGAWGNWTGAKYCSEGSYICGLEQKTEPRQGDGDDTGTTSIRFYCCSL